MTRRLSALVLALSAQAWTPPVGAQDRPVVPVVFVHGFGSSGATWQAAALRLESRLAIQTETPTLSATALYETQAIELHEQFGRFGADVVEVGHSNGGLVARQWSRHHPVSAILTVGTPHRGAPIVTNLYAYAGFNGGLLDSVNGVFRLFGQGCCDWQWILSASSNLWQLIGSVAASSLPQVASAVALNAALPVTPEMRPGSGFLTSINSPANLAAEMREVPVRAGIVSTAHNFYWGGALRAAYPDDGDQLAYLRDAARIGMEGYAAYIYASAPYEEWWAFDLADGMMTAASYLRFMDEIWCQSVSVVGLGGCWLNDTLVPEWSQAYPNGLFVDTGWDGPAHTQETRMSDALLEQVLATYAGIPPRQSSPVPDLPDAVFYDHVFFEGRALPAAVDQSFVGSDWNDRISSIHVPAGRTVVLYEHTDYGGASLRVSGDEADLRQHPGPGPDGTWNDVVSSLQIY